MSDYQANDSFGSERQATTPVIVAEQSCECTAAGLQVDELCDHATVRSSGAKSIGLSDFAQDLK